MNRDYTKPNCSMEIDKVCDKMETESMCKGSFYFRIKQFERHYACEMKKLCLSETFSEGRVTESARNKTVILHVSNRPSCEKRVCEHALNVTFDVR